MFFVVLEKIRIPPNTYQLTLSVGQVLVAKVIE